MRTSYLIGGAGVALLVILVITFWPESEETPPETDPAPQAELQAPEPQVAESEPAPPPIPIPADTPPPEPEIVLPPLADSDPFVREQVQDWPVPQPWLEVEGLVDRGAATLINVVQGKLPRRQLAFMAPGESFKVETVGERMFIKPESYARYTPLVERIETVAPERAVALFDTMAPLFDQALTQLGDQRDSSELLLESLERLLAVPVVEGPIEVERPGALYKFADPRLETQPEFTKQLIRMGPENLRRLKAYAERFKAAYRAHNPAA